MSDGGEMSAFEDKLRSKLAERAEQMPVEPDLADVHARIERQERGRDTRFNTAALLGAAAVVAVIIGLAVVMTRPEPRLINSAKSSLSRPYALQMFGTLSMRIANSNGSIGGKPSFAGSNGTCASGRATSLLTG